MSQSEEQVRHAIEAIALAPSTVGLTHAKILRDEIIRLRSQLAAKNQELKQVDDLAQQATMLMEQTIEIYSQLLAAQRDENESLRRMLKDTLSALHIAAS